MAREVEPQFGRRRPNFCYAFGVNRHTNMMTSGTAARHTIGTRAEGLPGSEEKRGQAVNHHNTREATRRQQGKKVKHRKHPVAMLWEKLFPPSY